MLKQEGLGGEKKDKTDVGRQMEMGWEKEGRIIAQDGIVGEMGKKKNYKNNKKKKDNSSSIVIESKRHTELEKAYIFQNMKIIFFTIFFPSYSQFKIFFPSDSHRQ